MLDRLSCRDMIVMLSCSEMDGRASGCERIWTLDQGGLVRPMAFLDGSCRRQRRRVRGHVMQSDRLSWWSLLARPALTKTSDSSQERFARRWSAEASFTIGDGHPVDRLDAERPCDGGTATREGATPHGADFRCVIHELAPERGAADLDAMVVT